MYRWAAQAEPRSDQCRQARNQHNGKPGQADGDAGFKSRWRISELYRDPPRWQDYSQRKAIGCKQLSRFLVDSHSPAGKSGLVEDENGRPISVYRESPLRRTLAPADARWPRRRTRERSRDRRRAGWLPDSSRYGPAPARWSWPGHRGASWRSGRNRPDPTAFRTPRRPGLPSRRGCPPDGKTWPAPGPRSGRSR